MAFYYLSASYFSIHQYEESLKFAQKSIDHFNEQTSDKLKAVSWGQLGRANFRLCQYLEALKAQTESLQIWEKDPKKHGILRIQQATGNLAIYQSHLKLHRLAGKTFLKSVKMLEDDIDNDKIEAIMKACGGVTMRSAHSNNFEKEKLLEQLSACYFKQGKLFKAFDAIQAQCFIKNNQALSNRHFFKWPFIFNIQRQFPDLKTY